MAEDLPAEEVLKQIVERLELLERVLGSNTARLHSIEEQFGLERPPQPFSETPASDTDNPQPAVPQVGASEVRKVTPIQPPQVEKLASEASYQASPDFPERPSEPTWLQSETQTAAPGSHSWMNESTGSPDYSTREAETPFGLHTYQEQVAPQRQPAPPAAPREEKRRDLEFMVGGSWFNWIGIIAVTFGAAFFLKFAFDKQWIGPTGRVTLCALIGVILLYLGDRLRGRGLNSYAYVLSGGGILILYLSDYAAYNFYHLVGQPVAFVLMAAVTTTAVLLSVRLNAWPVALLGLIGGFLTPLLLSTGVDNQIALFTYIALLDAGVLAVAYFKSWRSLDFLSFAGTLGITLGWAFTFFTPEKIWPTLVFLSIFFVLYSLLPIFHNVLRGKPTRWFDLVLSAANATLYFGLSYALLVESHLDQATPATQALLLSVFFTGLFYTTWRWSPDDRLLRYSYVGAAATFLAMAVAIQLDLHWVTIGWAVEALMLMWLGLRSRETAARHASLAIFCVAIGHWFIRDLPVFASSVDASFLPLLNRRALSGAVLIAAIADAAWLCRRNKEIDANERWVATTFFALTGNTVALMLLSLDISDYFGARLGTGATGWQVPLENTRQFSLAILWTIYATSIFAIGVLRRFTLLRWGGLLLLLAAIIKVVSIDSAFYAALWHLPLLNQTFIIYALQVAALSFAAWFYRQAGDDLESERRAMMPVLLGAANLLALVALSLEVIGYYDRALTRLAASGSTTATVSQFHEAQVFLLALVWTLYAAGAFMVGVRWNARAWRWGGLLLLALTSVLVLATLGYYDAPWHTLVFNRTFAAFVILIAALWLVIRTYARAGQTFEEQLSVRLVATVVANVLAIIALSAQAAGYYEAQILDELRRGAVLFDASVRNLELAKQLSLSVVWALYASGMFVAARICRLRLLRLMALALLSLTTIKVFIWDLSSLDRVYRVISFIMLGAILLVVSYFYQRNQQPVEET